MSDYDWSGFSARIDVKANADDLYSAWTTRTGLERWFLRTAEFTRPDGVIRDANERIKKGDRYRWLWHGYDDSAVEQGEVIEVNDRGVLKFTFAGNCIVSVRMLVEQGATIVELRQENIPVDAGSRALYHLGCLTGWTFYLANLKSILEGGIDLRNKNLKLRKLVNA